MIVSLVHYFFPELDRKETRKFGLLGLAAFFVLGTYWLMRQLKQTIFFKIAFPASFGWVAEQGSLFQPLAKTWSPFVVLAIVLIYSKLVDLVKKHQLFYIICSFYGLLFAGIGGILLIRELYGQEVLGRSLLAAVGWISYFATESFGSLVIALFWSFTNSVTDSESAQRGFPVIIVLAQLGAIAGASILLCSESVGTLWPLVLLTSLLTFLIMGMIWYFMRVIPASELVGNRAAKATESRKEGFIEGFVSGLVLLMTRPYLLGVLIISTIDSVAMSIIEYQMDRQVALSPCYASETSFCWFQGMFGVSVNLLAFIIALVGTSFLIRVLGVRWSLLVYPVVFAVTLFVLFVFFIVGAPTAAQLLWATFIAMMIFKGLSYAFNNPVKEIMYIPTSKDAKFKSKGWIDMFGSRFAKATGAQITGFYKHHLAELMFYGSLFSFGMISIWILAALYVGSKNEELVKTSSIIE
jgi:ATP:ADP antiporter, AAA family